MKIALRVAWLIISFLFVEIVVFLPLYLVGLIVFPIAYRYASKTIKNSITDKSVGILAFSSPILDEWLGNREDGLLPHWWASERNGTAFGWFVRNPVCNMRFWPVISALPSKDTAWVGTLDHVAGPGETGWFFCWEGWYSGFFYQGKWFGCWFGWKTNPRDAGIGSDNPPPVDYRAYGIGIAAQIWRNK